LDGPSKPKQTNKPKKINELKGGPEPSNFEDLSLVNVSVKYFSKLCFGTIEIQPELKYLKPFLKSSPLDFSGQRLGNTSLVKFLRFQSFSLVVKWPEFVRVYITNILRCSNVKLAQCSEGLMVDLYHETLGRGVSMGSYPFPFGNNFF